MIDISNETRFVSDIVDPVARLAVPSTIGISTGPYGTIVHLPDGASAGDQTKISDILANYGSLVVSADKTTMNEGDADPVVTCDDASIVGDTDIGFLVLLNGIVYAEGTDSVVAGTAELTLGSPIAGVYDIYVYRLEGNFAIGSVRITVSEV